MCFDLRQNQDMSLGEIAEELHVSRQGVYDNLSRAEAMLRNMEDKTGCVGRDLSYRKAIQRIVSAAAQIEKHQDRDVAEAARKILLAAADVKE